MAQSDHLELGICDLELLYAFERMLPLISSIILQPAPQPGTPLVPRSIFLPGLLAL